LQMNRYVTAALALAITLAYASLTWFAFERRLTRGPAARPARAAASLRGASQAPQSRA
jgi:hypothetical protein